MSTFAIFWSFALLRIRIRMAAVDAAQFLHQVFVLPIVGAWSAVCTGGRWLVNAVTPDPKHVGATDDSPPLTDEFPIVANPTLDPVWDAFYADPLSAPLPKIEGSSPEWDASFAALFPTANVLIGATA